jgi:hypothetical protein
MPYKTAYHTYNPADLAIIKSILEENDIDYFTNGEWSGGVYPVAIGMEIMVAEDQLDQANELIEDFKKETSNP